MSDEDFTPDTLELARCAQINLSNIEQLVPMLKRHPLWQIAMVQFGTVIKRLEVGNDAAG